MKTVKNIENLEGVKASSAPVVDTYSDDELQKAGLLKVSTFIRTEQSKNALRVKRSKEKKKASLGISQVNVQVPDDYKSDIKKLAKHLSSGGSVDFSLLYGAKPSLFTRLKSKFFFLFGGDRN